MPIRIIAQTTHTRALTHTHTHKHTHSYIYSSYCSHMFPVSDSSACRKWRQKVTETTSLMKLERRRSKQICKYINHQVRYQEITYCKPLRWNYLFLRLRGLTGSAFDHRSMPPEFESRRWHIWRVFHLWLRFITSGGAPPWSNGSVLDHRSPPPVLVWAYLRIKNVTWNVVAT